MASSLKENWDEFDWEQEIRKDDARVHAYLQELPDFIDLPQEEAVIYRKIQRRPELVPHDGVWPDLKTDFNDPRDDEFDPDEDADPENPEGNGPGGPDFLGDSWQTRDGANIYILASRIACEVSFRFAEERDPAAAVRLTQISCLCGKVMARAGDIIRLEPDEMPSFRIAFGKRFVSDANLLIGLLRNLPHKKTDPALDSWIALAYDLRDMALELIRRARRGPEKSAK